MELNIEQNKVNAKNLVKKYCEDDIKQIFEQLLYDNIYANSDKKYGIRETWRIINKYFRL